MTLIETLTDQARSILQQQGALPLTASWFTPADWNFAWREALDVYDRDRPAQVVADLTGDGTAYDLALPAGYLDRVSRIVSVEYPAGQRDPIWLEEGTDYTLYRTAAGVKLRFQLVIPQAAQTVRLTYTKPHIIEGFEAAVATTVPAAHRQALAYLTASRMMGRNATRMLHDIDNTLGSDGVDRNSKSDVARRLANWLDDQYARLIGKSKYEGEGAAMSLVEWDSGEALTHWGRRW